MKLRKINGAYYEICNESPKVGDVVAREIHVSISCYETKQRERPWDIVPVKLVCYAAHKKEDFHEIESFYLDLAEGDQISWFEKINKYPNYFGCFRN